MHLSLKICLIRRKSRKFVIWILGQNLNEIKHRGTLQSNLSILKSRNSVGTLIQVYIYHEGSMKNIVNNNIRTLETVYDTTVRENRTGLTIKIHKN